MAGREWRQILEEYRQTHPKVLVLDPPDAIKHLQNHQSMLQCVADMNLSEFYDNYSFVDIRTKQLVVKRYASSIPEFVAEAGLRLPLGSSCAPIFHGNSFLSDFISHLFRLLNHWLMMEAQNHMNYYLLIIDILSRNLNLHLFCRSLLTTEVFSSRFPRVSCAAAAADDDVDLDLDRSVAELPPLPLLERLAKELRQKLGLRLFNLDIIREHGTRDRYYVIDINYFPGK
ncbi:Inositol-tetrakisphosphate 1-kinase 3 [Hibiscus syriacus]|uniref:Inositol-tetrakisphosphate 1-kinase 3 n=1 Tax=Hibiscus syriacus TaxID=106335 RepID=A0A6A2Y8Z4_HIBSY|nr:Inositol-tetrakisphosphate 1-kinase 3 [Hibiscus syriacus]